jgi:predicted RNA-binding protein with RPS1 domain
VTQLKEHISPLQNVVEGTVTGLGEYYAYLDLKDNLGKAIVHISKLSNRFDPPPISNYLEIGSQLRGLAIGYDFRTGRLEISPRDLNSHPKRRSEQLLDWKVTYANEFESVLTHDDLVGVLRSSRDGWCRYRVLRESGILVEGATIAANCSGEVSEDNREILKLPTYQVHTSIASSTILTGDIVFWRKNTTRKKDQMLRNILYVHTERGFLFRIECNNVISIEKHFSIGDSVSFFQCNRSLNGIAFGDLSPETQIRTESRAFQVGERVQAKVVRLLPGGALVLVGDDQEAFLSASTVLPGKGFIGSVLSRPCKIHPAAPAIR